MELEMEIGMGMGMIMGNMERPQTNQTDRMVAIKHGPKMGR